MTLSNDSESLIHQAWPSRQFLPEDIYFEIKSKSCEIRRVVLRSANSATPDRVKQGLLVGMARLEEGGPCAAYLEVDMTQIP